MKRLGTLVVAMALVTPVVHLYAAPSLKASDQKMVQRASPYMPTLKAHIDQMWPDMQYPVTLAALVEQESFWNPHAELCVPKPTCSREYGFGFGQLTVTKRFNAFNEVKQLNPVLRNWKWEDRFNPDYQLLGIVLKNRQGFRQCSKIMNPGTSTYACTFSSYNGGFGGVVADRRVCSNTIGCDPKTWFGNVELTSMKAKEPLPGYGESFYSINRHYVRNVLIVRPPKYAGFDRFGLMPQIDQ